MPMKKVKIKAVGYALIVFSILFIGVEVQRRFIHPFTGQDFLIFWLNLYAFLVFIIPGYISAYLAKKWGTVHGLITGLTAMVLATGYYLLLYRHAYAEFAATWYLRLALGAACGGVGGLIWDAMSMLGKLSAKYRQDRGAET
jgi:hypothetical protein